MRHKVICIAIGAIWLIGGAMSLIRGNKKNSR